MQVSNGRSKRLDLAVSGIDFSIPDSQKGLVRNPADLRDFGEMPLPRCKLTLHVFKHVHVGSGVHVKSLVVSD